MYDYVAIVKNHPEGIFLALCAYYFPLAFLHHPVLYIIGDSHYCRRRVRVANYEMIRNSSSYRFQVKGYNILCFFFKHRIRNDLKCIVVHFRIVVIFVKNLANISKFRTMTKKHDIIWYDSVESTNDVAKSHIDELDNLSVVSAYVQTAGRGQGEHKWLSEPGANLLFSIVIKPAAGTVGADAQFGISDATAHAVIKLLDANGIEAWMKPPNDVYVGKDKICGILIENGLQGDRLRYSIIGVGLNVNQTEFDPTLPNPISMRAITGRTYDVNILLDEFMKVFCDETDVILSWQL